MSLEWSMQNTEASKPAAVEKTVAIEHEQSFEPKLSPEQIEGIMAKVQDINKLGTAYHTLLSNGEGDYQMRQDRNLKRILAEGILGNNYIQDIGQEPFTKEEWVKNTRTTRNSPLYVNIIGRAPADPYEDDRDRIKKVSDSGWVNREDGLNRYTIIFDSAQFKDMSLTKEEKVRLVNEGYEEEPAYLRKTKSYIPNRFKGGAEIDLVDHELLGKRVSTVNNDAGFKLFHRVSPRLFTGVIFEVAKKRDESERKKLLFKRYGYGETYYKELESGKVFKYYLDDDRAVLVARAREIGQMMLEVDSDKPERLVPIYDLHGNMWWPKQMNYKEVKQFVAERDVKDKDEEEK